MSQRGHKTVIAVLRACSGMMSPPEIAMEVLLGVMEVWGSRITPAETIAKSANLVEVRLVSI
jgi:hypothetical protein